MKNNVVFNKGLFKEGMRQMRTLGLVYACIGALAAFFTGNSYIVDSNSNSIYSYNEVAPFSGSMIFLGFIGVFVVVPIMFLSMFGYLNSRSASDFYHSIPSSRLSVVTSFTSAIAIWFLAGIIPDMIVEIVVGAFCGIEIKILEILTHLLVLIVSFIQFAGIMLISVSLATRTMNQVVLSMAIAFLPRIMILILNGITENGAPVLVGLSDTLGRFGDVDINLLFGGVFNAESMVVSGDFSSVIYSLVLGMIYCFLGVVCYIRRKSETATVAGANKYVQCAIRVLVAFVFCIIPCFVFGTALIGAADSPNFEEELFILLPSMLVMYGLAVIAYFAYEAISMRKIKGVLTLRGTMGIGLVLLIVLNLAFTITPAVGARIALSTEINTGNVESVVFIDENFYHEISMDYQNIMIDNYVFTDDEIIDIVCDNLEDNIEMIENGRNLHGYTSRWRNVSVKFNMTDGRVLRREVFIAKADYDDMYERMFSDPDFFKLVRKMPAPEEVEGYYTSRYEFDEGQMKQLYESLYSELTAMSDAEYLEYLQNSNGLFENEETIYIDGITNGTVWSNNYHITSKTPETQKLMIEFVVYNKNYIDYQ